LLRRPCAPSCLVRSTSAKAMSGVSTGLDRSPLNCLVLPLQQRVTQHLPIIPIAAPCCCCHPMMWDKSSRQEQQASSTLWFLMRTSAADQLCELSALWSRPPWQGLLGVFFSSRSWCCWVVGEVCLAQRVQARAGHGWGVRAPRQELPIVAVKLSRRKSSLF